MFYKGAKLGTELCRSCKGVYREDQKWHCPMFCAYRCQTILRTTPMMARSSDVWGTPWILPLNWRQKSTFVSTVGLPITRGMQDVDNIVPGCKSVGTDPNSCQADTPCI